MTKNSKLVGIILDSFFEGYTTDKNNKLKVVNEDAAKKASEALSTLVLEQCREWWEQLESAEGSLAHVADEISFEELNADASSLDLDTPLGAAGTDDSTEIEEPAAMDNVLPESDDLSSMFGSDDFDPSAIFEMDHLGGEEALMDAEGDDDDVTDGDEDFSDLQMGMDDNDMGVDDELPDEDGEEDMNAIGGDDEENGMDDMDDLGGDDMNGDDDIEDIGGDDLDDFDFSFLDDEEEGSIESGDDLGMGDDELEMDDEEIVA